ncbi:CDP-alcohol phosphatidyltransferase family protein [Legionella pneumophila 130b]|nr:CDP-alcohol phosphatidyltransferase family protein [Legionella pneumophila 130b]
MIPALWLNLPYLAISLLLLSGYCDTLDGTIARLTNHSSDWGSVLDIMTDRVVEVGVVFALWAINPNERGLGSLLMMASILLCITSFLVVGIFKTNDSEKSFHYSPGLIERAEAFVFL